MIRFSHCRLSLLCLLEVNRIFVMEFDNAMLHAWDLLREQSPKMPSEKLFAAAARSVQELRTAVPSASEVGRMGKWPVGTANFCLSGRDVQSVWSLSCLLALECHEGCAGDADKFQKRIRRGLQRSRGTLTDADEALILSVSMRISESQGEPQGLAVTKVVLEEAAPLKQRVVILSNGETRSMHRVADTPCEVLVA
jgi:hypothetical protein